MDPTTTMRTSERLPLTTRGDGLLLLGETELRPGMRVALFLWPDLPPLLTTVVVHPSYGFSLETDGHVFFSLSGTEWGEHVRFALVEEEATTTTAEEGSTRDAHARE